MGGSFNPIKIIKEAVKPITKVLTPDVPQVTQQAPAAAAAELPAVTATQDSETGISNEAASRKGKKSLTVRRSAGSGTGLNV